MGFSSPAWFLALALLAPLVWFHLRIRPRPPATVSSLHLWKQVAEQARPRPRRLRLPPLFFVQAALILASAFGLAGPYREEAAPPPAPRDAVVVLDVSASMQTRHGEGTRFDAALEAARARIAELADENRRVTLIRAASDPQIRGTGIEAPEALADLEGFAAVDVPANLTAAVELAASLAGRGATVDLFTDVPAAEIVMSREARAATRVHRFGEGGDNLAVLAARVLRPALGEGITTRIAVDIRNFSDRAREVEVALRAPEKEAEAPGSAIGRIARTAVGARGRETLLFEDPGWTGLFRVQIVGGDDLHTDDIAWGYLPASGTLDVLLVSDDDELARRLQWVGERASSFEVRHVQPQAYSPSDVADIVLFDRFVPPSPPSSNVAYLAPDSGNADVTVVRLAQSPQVAEKRNDPLLRGIDDPTSLIERSRVGLAPDALRSVLDGRSQDRSLSLLQEGEIAGRRIVASAFRIEPDRLSRADDLPTLLFVLNLISVLAPTAPDAPAILTTGERVTGREPEGDAEDRLRDPAGRIWQLAAGETLVLEQAGVWQREGRSGVERIVANFAGGDESDIFRQPPRTVPTTAVEGTPGPPTGVEDLRPISLLAPILVLLLALMVAEWILLARGDGSGSLLWRRRT